MQNQPTQPLCDAAGCVVYRIGADGLSILLIHDQYGTWTIPKGHLDPGETEAAAALRETREETGVSGQLGPLVERIAYTVGKDQRARLKHVAFFLLRAEDDTITPQADEGISAAGWFAPPDALDRIGYPQVRAVLERALSMIDH